MEELFNDLRDFFDKDFKEVKEYNDEIYSLENRLSLELRRIYLFLRRNPINVKMICSINRDYFYSNFNITTGIDSIFSTFSSRVIKYLNSSEYLDEGRLIIDRNNLNKLEEFLKLDDNSKKLLVEINM